MPSAKRPMRRVRVTFVFEEQPEVPFDEEHIRKWAKDFDLVDPSVGEYIESVEFPDGMYGEVSDEDLFGTD
jgi:hypothetical protein